MLATSHEYVMLTLPKQLKVDVLRSDFVVPNRLNNSLVMKNTLPILTRPTLRGLVLALAVAALSSQIARAHPYASGVSNASGTISFILNENADSVKVAFDNLSVTNDLTSLGQTNRGVNSFALGAHTNYAIIVAKIGSGTPAQLSVDTNPLVNFFAPRGVVVNRNPKTSNFGRIYASNATPGTSGGRAVGRGLYIMNADQSDALGRGTNASTAGVVFAVNASSPFMPGIGPDDNVYLNDWATPSATTWVFNPDITVSNLVLAGVGENVNPSVHTDSMNHPVVRGTLAEGNLQLWNVDGAYPPLNCMLRWDINSGPLPWNNPPSAVLGTAGNLGVADLTTDMDMGTDGKFYTSIYRSAGTDTSSIKVYDTDGTTQLWGSLTALGSPDPLRLARSLQVSLDGKYLAVTYDDCHISVILLTNGIPDSANILTISQSTLVGVGRSVAWDSADNVYMVTSGSGLLRAWSLGITTTAITSNDSTGTNGTFQLITPATTVSVVATQPDAHEAGPVNGTFEITRTDLDKSQPLTVNFAFAGTAVLGKNYTSSATNTIVIPANQASADITIVPKEDSTPDPTLTVILNLKGGAAYSAVAPNSATVTIADDSTPFLQITALSTNIFEGTPYDYARVTITRWGDTNQTVVVDAPNFTYAGTAVPNVDFYVTNLPITFNPGDVTQTLRLLYPIDNNSFDFAKTIKLGLAAGTGFTVSNSIFTTTLTESTRPTETVLWSDDLHTDTSANWTQLDGTTNGDNSDYTVSWAYDYSAVGIPPAPHSGTDTHGLRMTVNKFGNFNAAGLNFYPKDQVFSNNYALRFDMYVTEGLTSTTEYTLFGINQSGTKTNWFRGSGTGVPVGWMFDGLTYDIENDAAALLLGDYALFSSPTVTNSSGVVTPTTLVSRAAGTLAGVLKAPPYSGGAVGGGTPANLAGSTTPSWAQVEISQIGKLITMKINNTVILTYTNSTPYTNGNIMLGYDDAYDSVGDLNSSVIFANVQVVQIGLPAITTQPANAVTPAGATTNFTVVATTGTGLISYQWFRNNVAVANATNATLTITNVALANYGTYTVSMFDGSYTSLSSAATLTPPAPAIITAPISQAGATGGSATFTVVAATYTGVTNYQWQFYSTNLTGKTSASLTLAPLTSTSFGPYRVTVSDGFTTPALTSAPPAQLTAAVRQNIAPSASGSAFNLGFNTEIGPSYVVEWKGALTNGAWNQLKTNAGTGGLITVQDSPTTAGSRYYRVRMQ
jgi:hypothetical protein